MRNQGNLFVLVQQWVVQLSKVFSPLCAIHIEHSVYRENQNKNRTGQHEKMQQSINEEEEGCRSG